MLSQRAVVCVFLLSFVSKWNTGSGVELDDNVVLIDGKNQENPTVGNLRHGATFVDQKASLLGKKVSDTSAFGSEEEEDDEESISGIDADGPDNDPESMDSFYDGMVEDLQSACYTSCFSDGECDDVCPSCREGVCQKAPTCNEVCSGTGPGNCDQSGNCQNCVNGRCQARAVTCDVFCISSFDCNQSGCSGYQCVPDNGGRNRCRLSSQLPTCNQQCIGTGAGNCNQSGNCRSCISGRCQQGQGPSICNRRCGGPQDVSCNQSGCAGYQCALRSGGYTCTTSSNLPTCGQQCFGTGLGNCDPFGNCLDCVGGTCQQGPSICNRGCRGFSDTSCSQSGCAGYRCLEGSGGFTCRR